MHVCMRMYIRVCVCMYVHTCVHVCVLRSNLRKVLMFVHSSLEPLQCVSCSPTRPASSASAVSSSHTTTSSSKTDFTFEHCVTSINSLRWDNALSDEEEEEKRIEIYKEDRRRRYRALLEEQKRRLFNSKERRIFVSDGPLTQS